MVEDPERALWSIHSLLVVGRSLAYQQATSEELGEIFDAAEVLPLYILEAGDTTTAFRSVLEGIAERFPPARRALECFDGLELCSHYRGHLKSTTKPTQNE